MSGRLTVVVPDLGYRGHARQAVLLAPHLGGTVYSLRGNGPFAADLRAAGITVEGRGGRRLFDLDDLRELRWRLRDSDAVHVRGIDALRTTHLATLLGSRPPITLFLSGRERLGRLDRRLVRQAARIIVPHDAGRNALIDQGVLADRLRIVPPAVAPATTPVDRAALLRENGFPPDAQVFLAVGRIEDRDDLFWAMWGFEYLRYADPAMHLLLAGDGPGRSAVEQNAEGLAPDGLRARFLGWRHDARSLMGAADIFLALQPAGGVNAALEAMAAGLPVVAADTPEMRAILRDGETGLLAPPRSVHQAGRRMYRLLTDRGLRSQLGDAARRAVAERHAPEAVARQLA